MPLTHLQLISKIEAIPAEHRPDYFKSLTPQAGQALQRIIKYSRYRTDPVAWNLEVANQQPTSYQETILRSLAKPNTPIIETGVSAPRGGGKSWTGADAVSWFIDVAEHLAIDWKLLTTAAVHAQLRDFLWPQIHKLLTPIKTLDTGRDRLLEMRYKGLHGVATSRTARQGREGTIEGGHADWMFILIDEAKEVSDAVFDALDGTMSQAGTEGRQAIVLYISTPGHKRGRFYEFFTAREKHPNVTPIQVTLNQTLEANRISESWVERMRKSHGEQSQVYRNQVLGEFAEDDINAFIPLVWLEQSFKKWRMLMEEHGDLIEKGPWRLGVDPARHGPDSTVICWYNPEYNIVWKYDQEEYTANTAQLGTHLASMDTTAPLIIDTAGISGVYDAAATVTRTAPVISFMGNKPTDWKDEAGGTARNTRTASYLKIREMLNPANPNQLALPPDEPMLIGDLQAPRVKQLEGGKLAIQLKADIRKELGRSPDVGDATTYAVWSEPLTKVSYRDVKPVSWNGILGTT